MGGSAAKAPTLPDGQPVNALRASDADRDEVIAKLTEEFAAGRLSHHTFLFRMHAVLEARHQSDLPPLLADLPATPDPGEQGPAAPEPLRSAASRADQAPSEPGGPPAQGLPAQGLPAQGLAARPPAGRRPGLVGRLRDALPRLARSGATVSAAPASPTPVRHWPARRLTDGMPRASAEARRPAPLQFPRGTGPLFSIGRDAGCDMTIADMTVSRVHARLERTPDGWLLADLDSTNGTRVNGWRVRGNVPVRAGDLVSFGKAEYWLSAADGI